MDKTAAFMIQMRPNLETMFLEAYLACPPGQMADLPEGIPRSQFIAQVSLPMMSNLTGEPNAQAFEAWKNLLRVISEITCKQLFPGMEFKVEEGLLPRREG